jgi:hypothetical protein
MTWNKYEDAPRDGTPILILDAGTFGPFSASVRYQEYEADVVEAAGEPGYWSYCDETLNDVCPQGPETPFQWMPDPAVGSET